MYMYQGLGQMLTMCLQHHQGCLETPKCAYVIYGQPLIGSIATDPMKAINLEQFTVSESDHLHSAVAASTPLSPGGGRRDANISAASQHPSPPLSHWQYWPSVIRRPEDGHPRHHHVVEQHGDRAAYGRNHTVYIRKLVRTTNTFL